MKLLSKEEIVALLKLAKLARELTFNLSDALTKNDFYTARKKAGALKEVSEELSVRL